MSGGVSTIGDQTYADPVELGSNTVLTGNDVTFRNTIDSVATHAHTLTVNTTGNGVTSFEASVGVGFTDSQLGALTTDPDGVTEFGNAALGTPVTVRTAGATALSRRRAFERRYDAICNRCG